MSTAVGIEGEREFGKDVRSNNGTYFLIQFVQQCQWLI